MFGDHVLLVQDWSVLVRVQRRTNHDSDCAGDTYYMIRILYGNSTDNRTMHRAQLTSQSKTQSPDKIRAHVVESCCFPTTHDPHQEGASRAARAKRFLKLYVAFGRGILLEKKLARNKKTKKKSPLAYTNSKSQAYCVRST